MARIRRVWRAEVVEGRGAILGALRVLLQKDVVAKSMSSFQ